MSMRRTLLGAATALCASAVVAAPARATLSVSSVSVTPSTTQAGGIEGKPGPNITIDARFSSSNGDTPQDLTIALAPGLLANPTGVPPCSTANFNAGICPASSQIGSGYITGIAPEFGLALSLPTYAYLIRPTGSEIARMGVVVYFFGFPVVTESAPISIRTTPDVGINIPLTSLPNQLDGIDAILTHLNLTIDGMVDGKTFTRNPTSCSPATTTVTVDSYESPTTSTTGQSSFTPTGCGTLPYAPKLSGVASHDTGDDGAGFAATITQTSGQADNTNVLLTLPASLSPRLSLLASACTNPQPLAVPDDRNRRHRDAAAQRASGRKDRASGTRRRYSDTGDPDPSTDQPATQRNPDHHRPCGWSAPGRDSGHPAIEPHAEPSGRPQLAVQGRSPSVLDAAGGERPLHGLERRDGESVRHGGRQRVRRRVDRHLGKRDQDDGDSCRPPANELPGSPTRDPRRSAVGDGMVSYATASDGHPSVMVAVGSGRRAPLSSVSIRLAHGVSVDASKLADHLRVVLDGNQVDAKVTVRHRVVDVAFGRSGRVAIITLSGAALRESATTASDIRSGHAGKLTTLVTEASASGRTTVLKLRQTVR